MTFAVFVEPREGQFVATLAGVPEVRVVGASRGEAIEALKAEIAQRVRRGELLALEIGAAGASEFAGKYAADPTLRQICDHAYRQRDAELNP